MMGGGRDKVTGSGDISMLGGREKYWGDRLEC